MSTMINLKPGMCRWPVGNPEDENFHFCGGASSHALSYCEEHMVTAHAPARKPSAKAA